MPLPLFKLAALVAKQISKPLAKILKDKANTSVRFRKYFIIPVANAYHNWDIILRMRVLGLGKPDQVPKLTEKAAIDLGGDILSEFFVFSVAAGLIFLEYYRQSSNTVKKETDAANKVVHLEQLCIDMSAKLDAQNKRLVDLSSFAQDQKSRVDELNARLTKMDNRSRIRVATQAAQTTDGKQIGKVLYARDVNGKRVAGDVTGSIMYQVADQVAEVIKKF